MSFIGNTLSQESQEGSLLQALSATSPVVVVGFIQGKLATALPTGYVNDLFFLGFCHFLPLS
jgi:mannose/fructose/N-acetylgalactosamine-specific phosphotransferase system component IIC